MLLPEAKEREYRFKLALRMGLPIFALAVIVLYSAFSLELKTIPTSFYVAAAALLAVTIYYIFYLIYQGFEERITDPITHTFTREHLLPIFEKAVRQKPYTIILVSVDNLQDINIEYGTKNGDVVLFETAQWIGGFLQEKGIDKFPIGHYKGGDFLIGLEGDKFLYKNALDLLCLKAENKVINDIEVKLTGAIVDTTLTKETEKLISRLFDLQNEARLSKIENVEEEEIDPTELEAAVIDAVKERTFSLMFQKVEELGSASMVETSVKLLSDTGKLIHQNSFLPVINRLGLSREFDMIVLEMVLGVCSRSSENLIFALTLFPTSVRNHRFFEQVQILFANNESARGRIMFVLGEHQYYNQLTRYNELLQSYRRLGIFIALDRLGTYQTTLLYLKELGVDVVRFDANYGKHIKEEKNRALLRGLVVSAAILGVKSWIRMIEDEESYKIAKSLGIDFIQGNYLGKIAPIEALENNT
jgi:EAL domain-containing protein (putative c-di-GMP-specific phosphodiesterase class I)/GGDEF domain-containing protein